jgi:hypothetical protein
MRKKQKSEGCEPFSNFLRECEKYIYMNVIYIRSLGLILQLSQNTHKSEEKV